jgi:hypothetical protein
MRTLKRQSLLLITFLITAYCRPVDLVRAQQATPEFQLDLHYSDAGGGHPSGNAPVAFGYDPSATDSGVDKQFGEAQIPLTSPGGFELAFEIDPIDGSLIDILQKPTADSFILQYTLYLSADLYPAVLSWDRSKIPTAIKGIWITPYGEPSFKMADMVTQDSVIIDAANPTDTNYYLNWGPAVITLYYNTEPYFLGVSETAISGSGLLSALAAYPNPMSENSALSFNLSEPAYVSVTGCDAAGREVLRIAKYVSSGANLIDLSSLANARGAIFLRVDAESSTTSEVKTLVVMKE